MSKRPRHYAAEIIALRSDEERQKALRQVPEAWRGWVGIYVSNHFDRLRYLRRRLGGAAIINLRG